ncbi:MAG: EAL domain-containing protein, partial [Campylobacteraceae bacterium]|nr:EAL domain-containing protein [Campylobacteraceae bacterium]
NLHYMLFFFYSFICLHFSLLYFTLLGIKIFPSLVIFSGDIIISVGKFDLTFKVIVPLYEGKKIIGLIETIAKFDSVALEMKKNGFDIAIVVDKKYKHQLINTFTRTFIKNYYIANKNIKANILKFIKSKSIEYFILHKNYYVDKNQDKFIIIYRLPDLYGKPMAYFIIFYKLSNIDMSDILNTRNNSILFFVFIYFLFLGGAYYLYSLHYKNLIEILNEKLKEKVKKKTEVLNHIAYHDNLTNLPNRLLFVEELQKSISRASRHKHSIYVLFLDLDRFKEVNDSYGHDLGDKLLKNMAKRLLRCTRKEDTVARLGGDEFTIVAEDINALDIVSIVKKIILKVSEPMDLEEHAFSITCSIGISNFPIDGDSVDILLRNADTAMYRAKELGKNTYQFYNKNMTEEILSRLHLINNLKKAIKNEEFVAYFQPQIDSISGKLVGSEALIRWLHPIEGIIPPDRFIMIAEEIGLIKNIDIWMMKKTIGIYKKLQKEGLNAGKLSLNLSIVQLESKGYIQELKSILKNSKFNPKDLILEITENQLMNNIENAKILLNEISKLGISISIDDFGTGYSSLSYIKHLPIDKMKIDKCFVDNLPNNKEDVAIVRSIIALAKSLNIELIAEGVEKKEQKDFLLKEGCSYIQGYYYSKPLRQDDFRVYLKNKEFH